MRGLPPYLAAVAVIVLMLPPGEAVAADKWLGTAPFCKAKRSDCSKYGMEYVRESKTGNGKKCVSGKKVLCRGVDPKSRAKYTDAKWRGWGTCDKKYGGSWRGFGVPPDKALPPDKQKPGTNYIAHNLGKRGCVTCPRGWKHVESYCDKSYGTRTFKNSRRLPDYRGPDGCARPNQKWASVGKRLLSKGCWQCPPGYKLRTTKTGRRNLCARR